METSGQCTSTRRSPGARQDVSGETRWTFTDHLGTPLLQTSAQQGIVWRAEHEPYGQVYALRAQDLHQPLRLPGQEAEQLNAGANGATGRSYNVNRWYEPSLGRYTSADPMSSGLDAYSYAAQRPLDQLDPLGLYTATLNRVIIHPIADPKGFPSKCKNAAGGCTLHYQAILHCDCVCANDGKFKASCLLNISADIYVYSGDDFLDHFHPKFDSSVKNYATALHHEEYVHLLAAARERHVRRMIRRLEKATYDSEKDCNHAWTTKVGPVNLAYKAAVRGTQLRENLGFVH
jgi:RHS repeat-associated protein